jgi:Holliday junction resolvasome RuvABC endonuclease subunit
LIVAAIDSAETSGLAVVNRDDHGESVFLHDTVRISGAADVEAAVSRLALHRPDLVVVEEPFVSPRFPGAGLSLSRLVGGWCQAAETRGLTVVTIPAALWQPAVLVGINGRSRSAERKAASRAFVRGLFGLEVGEDAADAIGLAVYAARNASRKAA